MAGVTSSSDAEAVVTSIRLLVAEQALPPDGAAPKPAAPLVVPTAPPASPAPRPAPLLLLPAFRVDPPQALPPAAAPMTLEQRMAALEAQLSALAAVTPADVAPPARPPDLEAVVPAVEEALIDEDSLREIVAGLVREELRGELGERITRNVRRMIRRELHQALALLDLEQGPALPARSARPQPDRERPEGG